MTLKKVFGTLVFARFMPSLTQKVAQRLIGGPRLETTQFSDGKLFDCFTSEKYYWFGDSYEADERRAFEACVTPDSVIFDVGAHVGFWEVILASQCRHIYAFEPSARNFTRLAHNVSQNDLRNVTLVPAAASDKPGKLHLIEDGSMTKIAESGQTVNAIVLDDFVAENMPPDIVKIDIEGYGASALRGLKRTLGQYRPTLFIELHDPEEVAACTDLLDVGGYLSLPLGDNSRFPYRSQFVPRNGS